ncbi:molybdopterin-dependent oxidoreductase [Vibrio sp. RE86]|uniref:molybdopterin-dependent oxidoreductase n=1 Tax=Vibrio sp. RE86 TaxID=2607605 RepID=UPI001493CB2E|nr:molybdopterin-dependent oxidoreductase [Vibrio sp. RE86]NOH78527.1 molybdopterin-dependent oxidoreductase [Vibrio sp. RE86]
MRSILPVFILLFCANVFSSELVIRIPEEQEKTLPHSDIIKHLPSTTFATSLPWFKGKNSFTGFKVTDLLTHLNIDDAFSVSFIALNDYAASSQIDDIEKYQPIVAYKMNDKKMKVRDKGPYWLIFNLDEHADINNAVYHSQMVWQIDEILIHRHKDVEKQ